jgi:hypothetical protein
MYPKYILDNTIKNATSCKATNNGLRLEGCYAGVPFPIPKTGNEVVWNHVTLFFAQSFGGMDNAWIVDANGKMILQGLIKAWEQFPYWDPDRVGPAAPTSLYWQLRFEYLAPARTFGQKFVILDGLDPLQPGRRAWSYIPGQRRVKLAPDLAYDTPSPASGGASTMDEQTVFLGGQDRYDMKLHGKKEIYMIYDSNNLYDYKVCPPEVALTKNFVNPKCLRWELHRTWEVEATLKPGFRHILPRRMMYFDEDTPGAAWGDMYDASGKIYRVDYSPHSIFYAQQPQAGLAEQAFTYDLQTGIVSISSWMTCAEGCGWVANAKKPDVFFSPETIAGEGIR